MDSEPVIQSYVRHGERDFFDAGQAAIAQRDEYHRRIVRIALAAGVQVGSDKPDVHSQYLEICDRIEEWAHSKRATI